MGIQHKPPQEVQSHQSSMSQGQWEEHEEGSPDQMGMLPAVDAALGVRESSAPSQVHTLWVCSEPCSATGVTLCPVHSSLHRPLGLLSPVSILLCVETRPIPTPELAPLCWVPTTALEPGCRKCASRAHMPRVTPTRPAEWTQQPCWLATACPPEPLRGGSAWVTCGGLQRVCSLGADVMPSRLTGVCSIFWYIHPLCPQPAASGVLWVVVHGVIGRSKRGQRMGPPEARDRSSLHEPHILPLLPAPWSPYPGSFHIALALHGQAASFPCKPAEACSRLAALGREARQVAWAARWWGSGCQWTRSWEGPRPSSLVSTRGGQGRASTWAPQAGIVLQNRALGREGGRAGGRPTLPGAWIRL